MENPKMVNLVKLLKKEKIHFDFQEANVSLKEMKMSIEDKKKHPDFIYLFEKENGQIVSLKIEIILGSAIDIVPEQFENDNDLILIGKLYAIIKDKIKSIFPEIEWGQRLNIIYDEEEYYKRIEMVKNPLFDHLLQKWVKQAEKESQLKEKPSKKDSMEKAMNIKHKDGEKVCERLSELYAAEWWRGEKDTEHVLFMKWDSPNEGTAFSLFMNILGEKGFTAYPCWITREGMEKTILKGYQRMS